MRSSTFCPTGSIASSNCSAGTYNDRTGQASCTPCTSRQYQDATGATSCKPCKPGSYCPTGASAALPCLAGSYADRTDLQGAHQCSRCPPGASCATGSVIPAACMPGSFSATPQQTVCTQCPAGTYQSLSNATACDTCQPGFFCPLGSATPQPCPGGTYGTAEGLVDAGQCGAVSAGFWAPLGSDRPELCPPSGFYCPGRAYDTVNEPPGSKPILVATGGDVTQLQVETQTVVRERRVQTNLTLDQDLAAFDADALRAELAAMYGVPLEAITLEAQAGSVVVRIAIDVPEADAARRCAAAGEQCERPTS